MIEQCGEGSCATEFLAAAMEESTSKRITIGTRNREHLSPSAAPICVPPADLWFLGEFDRPADVGDSQCQSERAVLRVGIQGTQHVSQVRVEDVWSRKFGHCAPSR